MTPQQPDREPSQRSEPTPPALDRALDLVRFLRRHCEWDARQTPESLLPYLLEESHEVADAILSGQATKLRDELGDLLLNVAFQIVLAEERQSFDAEDVTARLEAKMRRRHPHLYGDGPEIPWEQLKARERGQSGAGEDSGSLLHGIASDLEPLSRAQRIQDRVAAVGFDWPTVDGATDKVAEELAEVRQALQLGDPSAIEEEVGDLLFSVVNVARLAGAHGMRALQRANSKFSRRWRALERLAEERGMVLAQTSLEGLDALWEEVKDTGDSTSGGTG